MGRRGWAVGLTVLAVLLILGQVSSVGPVLLSVTPEHGLHAGDVVVLGAWALGLVLLAVRRPVAPAQARHRA